MSDQDESSARHFCGECERWAGRCLEGQVNRIARSTACEKFRKRKT